MDANLTWIKGQQELGAGGLLHWQVVVGFSKPRRLAAVRALFPGAHAEPTRSAAADDYVWKEDTRVAGTQFDLGSKAFRRNNPTDWAAVRSAAQAGRLDDIPADVYVRCYNTLSRIRQDHLRPLPMERSVSVLWGPTGSGKTRRAYEEAGLDCFFKPPGSRWWDGYRAHEHVIIDEFGGGIDILDLLRWFDRYPCTVEVKGGTVCLNAKRFWVTSNLDPAYWFPLATNEHKTALMRRLTTNGSSITFMPAPIAE